MLTTRKFETKYAKNGIAVAEVKNYENLTAEEKEMLQVPFGDEISEYADFMVRRNKRNELLGVTGFNLSDSYEAGSDYDYRDFLTLINGNKSQFAIAKKRFESEKGHPLNLTQRQIRDILEDSMYEIIR